MILHWILGALAVVSFLSTLWQWLAARRFPLHRRVADKSFAPAVTFFKPLKGCDEHTESCLRSWLAQDYAGEVQALFAVASADDPACAVVRKLLAEFPQRDAQLVVCPEQLGANAKVSKLAQLEALAKHEILIVSDADVRVPPDFLANVVVPLRDGGVGLVNCFYRFTNPTSLAMRWEAVAVNADFWSMVLQGASFRKLDFALGAVMATRHKQLAEIGGFRALADCLADDFQLGNRIARRGHRIEVCPVVVECWSPPAGWREVWRHQLRWARTIRVCMPGPYFVSIIANATLWPMLWALASLPVMTYRSLGAGSGAEVTVALTVPLAAIFAAICLVTRIATADALQRQLAPSHPRLKDFWLVPVKDLLQWALWVGAFAGNHIEWRGEKYRLRRDGTLEKK